MLTNLYVETFEAIKLYTYNLDDVSHVMLNKNVKISFDDFRALAIDIEYDNSINVKNKNMFHLKKNISPKIKIFFNDGNFLERTTSVKDNSVVEFWILGFVNEHKLLPDNKEYLKSLIVD